MKNHDWYAALSTATDDFDPGCVWVIVLCGGVFTLIALAVICSTIQHIVEVLAR